MAIDIIWSSTNGGDALTQPIDHGGAKNGDVLGAQTVYVRHNGDLQIIDCKFYASPTPGFPSDFSEIIGWGDGTTQGSFGGLQINMNAVGGFPNVSWPIYTNKQPSSGSAFFTGTGDSEDNAIGLSVNMGLSNDGVIQPGDSPDVRFKVRFEIPQVEGTTGTRKITQRLRYTFTS